MSTTEALAALREALAAGTAHPVPTLRGWVRLAGVNAMVRVDLTTWSATVQQLDIAAPPGSDAGRTGAMTL